jgi:spermidine/putrescine transport system substrate-binding protein
MKRLALGVVLLAATLVGLGCSSAFSKQKLYIYNWTYYIPDEVLREFEKEFNCTVVYDMFASNEEMFAKLKAGGGGYDVVFPSGDYVSIMIKEGMVEALDSSRLPNKKLIDPTVVEKIKYDPGLRYSMPYMMGCAGVSVNKKLVANFEPSWSIFARADLANSMTMLEDMREVLGAALKSLGYSLNTTDTAQLLQAKEVVLGWKKNLLRFDSESFGKALSAGEVGVVQGYAENVFLELDSTQKESIEFFIPREGGPSYVDNMVILKGARNRDLAYKFINFIHKPAVHARIVDFLGLPCINTEARPLRTKTPNYDLDELRACEIKEDLGPALQLYNKIWQEIRIGS